MTIHTYVPLQCARELSAFKGEVEDRITTYLMSSVEEPDPPWKTKNMGLSSLLPVSPRTYFQVIRIHVRHGVGVDIMHVPISSTFVAHVSR